MSLPGRAVRLNLSLALALLTVGCVTLEGTARDRFASDVSCPPDRVTAAERKDLSSRVAPPKPPADVAADPRRLDFWNQKHADEIREAGSTKMFELKGCGQQRVMRCAWRARNDPMRSDTYASCHNDDGAPAAPLTPTPAQVGSKP
jgi:hypothetical protein